MMEFMIPAAILLGKSMQKTDCNYSDIFMQGLTQAKDVYIGVLPETSMISIKIIP